MTGLDLFTNKRILVVEDEFLLADDLCKTLQALGAVIIGPAPTLSVAIQLMENAAPIHAAVLDINLRDILSYEVADTLTRQNVPFMFTTGYDKVALPEKYRQVPRVHKPYGQRDVVEHLADMLR